jgi:hypothetical protein
MLALLLAAAVPTVGCSTHVEGPPPSAAVQRAAARQSVSVHGATFMGLRNAVREDFERRGAQHVYKAGLGVTYGAPLHVKVALRDRSWLALDYVRGGKPRRELRFEPCAPDTPRFSDDGVVGNETGWAGGFVVQRDGCATLLLRREGEKPWVRVRVGFGKRC